MTAATTAGAKRIDDAPHAGLSTCKWHDRGWMAGKATRIARLIRHYDEKGIAP